MKLSGPVSDVCSDVRSVRLETQPCDVDVVAADMPDDFESRSFVLGKRFRMGKQTIRTWADMSTARGESASANADVDDVSFEGLQ